MALWSNKKKHLHSSQKSHSLGDSFTSLADTVIRVIKRNGADAVEIERDSPTEVTRNRPATTRPRKRPTRKTSAQRATSTKRAVSAKTSTPKSTPKKHPRKQSASTTASRNNASPRRTAVQRVSSAQRSSSTKPSTRQSVSTTTRRTTKTSNTATRILIEPQGGRRLHVSEWQERVGLSDRCLNTIERNEIATSLADASPVGIKEAQTLNRKFQALGIGVGDKHGYYAVCGRDGVSFRKTSFSCLPEKEARAYPNVRYISAKVMDKQLERLFGLSLAKVKSTASADLLKQFGKLDEVLEQRSSKKSTKPKKSGKPRAPKPASSTSGSPKAGTTQRSSTKNAPSKPAASQKAQPKRKLQPLPTIDKIEVTFDKPPKASPKPQSNKRMNTTVQPEKPKVSVAPPPAKEPVAPAPKPSASAPAQSNTSSSREGMKNLLGAFRSVVQG